jgi:predicted DNA-binding mobile mystery protein A
MKKVYELLSIRQVDRKLKQFQQFRGLHPKEGWIAHIRGALSLPTAQLAKLMGIKQPSALAMEKREQDKAITLETLEKIANAMGCDLVYAFVPKSSLEDFVEQKRNMLVDQIMKKTHLTMSLENQGLNRQDLKDQKTLLLEDLKSRSMKHIWRSL